MANVADYQVLLDGATSFGGNENFKNFKFAVPTNMVLSSAAKMILSFKMRSSEDIKLRVEVNHSQVMSHTLKQSTVTRAFWTTFSPGIPFPEGSSLGVVDVRFFCDTLGTVVLEDIVIWHKVKV